jgi:hypothetical protein
MFTVNMIQNTAAVILQRFVIITKPVNGIPCDILADSKHHSKPIPANTLVLAAALRKS